MEDNSEKEFKTFPEGVRVKKTNVYGIRISPEPVSFDSTCSTTFMSGAMRSAKKLPFWKLGRRAKIEWAKRFAKGEHYDTEKGMTHNWKCALGTGDLQFIQQFYNHAEEHMLNFKELAEHGPDYLDQEGETMFDHLGASMWNIAALIEYLAADPQNTCKALSQRSEKI